MNKRGELIVLKFMSLDCSITISFIKWKKTKRKMEFMNNTNATQ